jgi:hypothetical protein
LLKFGTCHDIAEILLKVALNAINQPSFLSVIHCYWSYLLKLSNVFFFLLNFSTDLCVFNILLCDCLHHVKLTFIFRLLISWCCEYLEMHCMVFFISFIIQCFKCPYWSMNRTILNKRLPVLPGHFFKGDRWIQVWLYMVLLILKLCASIWTLEALYNEANKEDHTMHFQILTTSWNQQSENEC